MRWRYEINTRNDSLKRISRLGPEFLECDCPLGRNVVVKDYE